MECPVCFEIFRTPLLLPGCGHTICQNCAELLVTPENYLRCPECRLVYQLRRGVASLPKNIALQRTIDEHQRSSSRENLLSAGGSTTCEEHPGDAVSLYCRTCEKSICLKCYFSSNTLRKGQTTHAGHKVETSEDVQTKERRLLEENYNSCLERRVEEAEYIEQLQSTDTHLKEVLDKKLEEIEKNKNDLIAQVKKTASKLKFTLKGTAARDTEFLKMSLNSAIERMKILDKLVEETEGMKDKASSDSVDVNTIKETRKKLEVLPGISDSERPLAESFMTIKNFDTDLESCMADPKKALSYQIEAPRDAEICEKECIISDTSAHIVIKYNETVRVDKLVVQYKEAMYKGLSEKQWTSVETKEFSKGYAKFSIRNLDKGTMYRMFVKSVNDFGEGTPSKEVWFRTVEGEIEIRTT